MPFVLASLTFKIAPLFLSPYRSAPLQTFFNPLKVSCLNDIMETKGGKKSSIVQYEAPLGYVIEEVRPNGGIEKFHSAAYYNCARKPS
ncbi:hypothetical protein L7F22_044366 [Adiantum nelumboides]|nr:hypothetical protein [Adiantum nelumboides]